MSSVEGESAPADVRVAVADEAVMSTPAGKRRTSSVVEVAWKKAKVGKKVDKKVDKGVLKLMEYSYKQEDEAKEEAPWVSADDVLER